MRFIGGLLLLRGPLPWILRAQRAGDDRELR